MKTWLEPKRATWMVAIALFTLAIIAAGAFAGLKRLALAYDSVDYALYAQFAARLFDPQLSKSFSAQPDGYNFLGAYGTEGIYSFHQSLHLEPVKYLYALVFQLGKSLLPVYLLIAVLYFLPVLYLPAIHKIEQAGDAAFVLLFILSYALFPAVLAATTYDLRPRTLFVPFLTLALLAVLYRRPFPEKLVLIGLLFIVREEAILFAAVLTAVNFFCPGDRRRKLVETGVLALLCIAYAVVMGLYFKWTGYRLDDGSATLRSLLPYLTASGGILALISICGSVLWKQGKLGLVSLFQLLAFASLSVPLSIQLKTEVDKWKLAGNNLLLTAAQRFLFSEKVILYFIVTLLFAAMLWHLAGAAQKRKRLYQTWAVLVGLFFIAGCVRNAGFVQLYGSQVGAAQIVFSSLRATDVYQTRVLVDEKTYQAFYNYEHVTVYNRLPWSLAQEKRFFPENLPALLPLLPGIEYIVISRASDTDVLPLLAEHNIRFNIVDQNENYSVLKVIR